MKVFSSSVAISNNAIVHHSHCHATLSLYALKLTRRYSVLASAALSHGVSHAVTYLYTDLTETANGTSFLIGNMLSLKGSMGRIERYGIRLSVLSNLRA